MPLIAKINTISERLRTDCNILGDKIKKKLLFCVTVQWPCDVVILCREGLSTCLRKDLDNV
jgi:hypothetical protein